MRLCMERISPPRRGAAFSETWKRRGIQVRRGCSRSRDEFLEHAPLLVPIDPAGKRSRESCFVALVDALPQAPHETGFLGKKCGPSSWSGIPLCGEYATLLSQGHLMQLLRNLVETAPNPELDQSRTLSSGHC